MNHALLKLMVEAPSFKPLAWRIRAMWQVIKKFAPYAAIELVLPGGTVLAILFWLFRRRRVASSSVAHLRSIPRLTLRGDAALDASCASHVPRSGTNLAPRGSNRNAGFSLPVKLLERRSHLHSEGI